jgi:hypothetical protein
VQQWRFGRRRRCSAHDLFDGRAADDGWLDHDLFDGRAADDGWLDHDLDRGACRDRHDSHNDPPRG